MGIRRQFFVDISVPKEMPGMLNTGLFIRLYDFVIADSPAGSLVLQGSGIKENILSIFMIVTSAGASFWFGGILWFPGGRDKLRKPRDGCYRRFHPR